MLKSHHVFKDHRGEFLMDLLVVFGIMGLLMTIAIPYLRKFQPNLKLSSTARQLTSDLRYAQQLTITEQVVHKVNLDVINDKYEILKIDGGATTTIKTVLFDDDVTYQQVTDLTDNMVSFNYYGAVSQAGAITLTNTNQATAVINVKPSGYVQLEQ